MKGKLEKLKCWFLAFYRSGHLVNAALMDSVHWLFHLVHYLIGAFKTLEFHSFSFIS